MFKQKLKIPTTIRRASFVAILAVVIAASFVAIFGKDDQALAITNSTINFQARLLTAAGAVVPDGQYNVEFKLYNALSSTGSSQGSCSGDSACLWTETRTTSNKVRVVNGYLTVNLGSVTAFGGTINWDQEMWLGMNVGGTGTPGWDGEMSPRLKLTAVPYAFRAGALVGGSGSNITVLDTGTPSGSNTIHLPAESGTLCIQSSTNCGFAASSGSANYIQNGTSLQTANFYIQSASASSVGGIIRGAASQTSSLLQMLDGSTGYTIAQFSNNGYLTLGSDNIAKQGEIIFNDATISNTNTITVLTPAALASSRTITLPDETGTLCIQSSTNCGFAASSGSANYIQNQNATSQTANFRITGTGRADTSLQAPLLDTASAVTLAIGTTNATAINLNQNTTLASGKTLSLQGPFTMQPAADGTSVFNIKTSLGNNVFTLDSGNARLGFGLGGSTLPSYGGSAGIEIKGGLRLSAANSNYSDDYITPNGGTVKSLINVANFDPGATSQIVALGLPLGSDSTARVISLFDKRASAHQPTLGVLAPLQVEIGGLSWDGSNTDFLVKNSSTSGKIGLNINGSNALLATTTGVGINVTPNASYKLDVGGDVNISSGSSYRINGTAICTASGCTPASGSANYIQNQNAGQQSSSNFWISGTGRADTALQAPLIDTATAATLALGTTNATAINLNKSTTITGGLTQSGGTISLTGNGASSISTSSGNLTLQGGSGTVTFGTTTNLTASGALTISAGGTNTALALNSNGTGNINIGINGTANTIQVGNTSGAVTQAINIGTNSTASSTSNVVIGSTIAGTVALQSADTINIGNNGNNKTINIGVTGSTANTTAINIGTSTGAAQTVAAGSSHASSTVTLTGGGSKLTVANAGQTVQSTTNSTTAWSLQNATNGPVLNVDTTLTNSITNPSFEVDASGWAAKGGAAVSQQTTFAYDGNNSLRVVTSAAANDGAKYNFALAASTTYTFSVMVRSSADLSTLKIGYSTDGTTDDTNVACPSGQTSKNLYWSRLSCTFTTTTVSGTRYVYVKQTDNVSHTFYLDGALLEVAGSATIYRDGKAALGGSLLVNGGQAAASASTAALQVNALQGGGGLTVYGSGDGNIFQNAFNVYTADGSTNLLNVSDSVRITTVTGGNAFFNAPALKAVTSDAGASALDVVGATSQTSDILRVFDANSTHELFGVGPTGSALFKPATSSTTAFRVQNTSAVSIFNVDTTNSRIGINTESPSEALTVNGNFTVRDADSATKAVRFRTSGTSVDVESGGVDLYFSSWANANFTGTQYFWLRSQISANSIVVGGAASSDPPRLVLGTKNDNSSDPGSALNGAMYYNSTSDKFRCYQGGTWLNCLNGLNDAVTVSNDQGPTLTTATSASYASLGTQCGTSFIAPPSGKVVVSLMAEVKTSTAGSVNLTTIAVRTGGTVGSGTTVLAAADTNFSIQNQNTQLMMGSTQQIVSGLTAGSTYNVRIEARSNGTATLSLGRRAVTVTPVW